MIITSNIFWLSLSFTEKGEGSITQLAVSSLLKRCQDVLQKYVHDEKLSGKCPLPRPRISEMSFVLKAVSTLLASLKKAPKHTGKCFVCMFNKEKRN